MNKRKKVFISIIIFFSLLVLSCKVFATNYLKAELSEDFLEYLALSDEEKANTVMPRSYDVAKTTTVVKNPLKWGLMARSTAITGYSLLEDIPENMVVKNQMSTNSCWTFSSLAVLESNLALKAYKSNNKTKQVENVVVYDFSERHMEYATSQTFKNGEINPIGFRREVDAGGNFNIFIPYLTNGTGAIPEEEMQFENSIAKIDLNELDGKTVVTQVNDVITFPKYKAEDDKTTIIKQMKDHIRNYGAIEANIHGASLFGSSCYKNATGAINCKHTITKDAHAVAIIGWDDTYEVDNFLDPPANPGAWIIKNSWGTEYVRYTLSEMKEVVCDLFWDECVENGWTNVTQIPDDFAKLKLEEAGYTIENDEAVKYIGDKGFMYISYEDYNVYLQLSGIVDADEIEYENIYQYNQYGSNVTWGAYENKMYLATEFEKKTDGIEYLTQVSIEAPETYTCKVYLDTDGTDKSSIENLTHVQLKAGESETFDAGYHTLEFAEPIKIEGDDFLVVLEIQGTQQNLITALFEANMKTSWGKSTIWDNVTIESGKSFVSFGDTFNNRTWLMTSNLNKLTGGNMIDADTTLKAFTTSKILDNITIENPPQTTVYIEGQDFDTTAMVVNANYMNGEKIDITDSVTIQNGENLQLGQTEVTIIYEGKSVTQSIEVVENTVQSIIVKDLPHNLEYWAGEDFDFTGMAIEAIFRDKSTEIVPVSKEMVQDGVALKNNQTTVTIQYEETTVTQPITVKTNTVVELKISKAPDKTKYAVGQNFDSSGMVVIAKYAKGNEINVTDYEIKDGKNLQYGQKSVTIEYEGVVVSCGINVAAKSVKKITLETMPTKVEYIENKESLDLTGGFIKILYNDETSELMSMTSDQIIVGGFNNNVVGKQTLILTYGRYTLLFDVKVVREAKPVKSNFSNVQEKVKGVRSYYFTDDNKNSYTIIDVELNNIAKDTKNDKVEYYYYLSPNQFENNISDWVKIENVKEEEGKLSFEINTLDISNYEHVSVSENLYLYIKEVVTKNNLSLDNITPALILEVDGVKIEQYLDGEKKSEVSTGIVKETTPGDGLDNTTSHNIIPGAGKNMLIALCILGICVLGRVIFLIYKDIEIK